MKFSRFIGLLVIALTISVSSPAAANDGRAVVLVNSASQYFSDFQQHISPYLDNFGIPYTLLDIANNSIHQDIADKALIIIGHKGLDVSGIYLDDVEQSYITNAVFNGTGLVNFDNLLAIAGTVPRYRYVQDILGLTYFPNFTGNSISLTSPTLGSYISEGHDASEIITLKSSMTSLGMTPPQDAQVIATTGGEPFIVVREYGQGKAVQWGSYAFTDIGVLGYVYKLDDLVWRSLVWAARKPFVLQGMPPLLTFRIDDCSGPFWWAEDAVAKGFKPWIGFFLDDLDEADTTQLANLVNNGNATAAIHAFNFDFSLYYNHSAQSDYTDAEIAANFAEGTQWHQQHNIPISKYVVPHQYEFGSNAFDGLASWGIEFVGIPLSPGHSETPFSWLQLAPYREYASGSFAYTDPFYYADYLSIPGHPEYDGRFFNVVTEIRDNAGYEWFPDNDVSGSIARGVTQLKRAFDSMVLPTLFTHEQSIQLISRSNWNSILSGVVSGVASYHPIYTTMDSAAQYVRALAASNIDQSDFDPSTSTLTITLVGQTDIPTQFYLFTEQPAVGEAVIVKQSINVPVFSGSTQIVTQIDIQPSISLSPASLSASTVLGSNASSQSFQVGNTGGGTLSYTISDNAAWLSCTPTSGTSTGEQDTITVNYATSGLSAGTYSATITITAPGATNSPQTIPVSLNVVSLVQVWLEAESGSLTAPMAIGFDSQASSGAYVWIPEGTGDVLNGPSQAVGSVAYTFSVPVAGNYVVWGRLIDNLGNSFYVSRDSGSYALWDTAGGSTWGWDLVNNRDGADPVVYSLGEGQHTLVIKHREDGAKLDRILITNDRAYVPQGQGEVVSSAPLITSTAVTSAVVGQLYTYDVNATGNPAPTYSLVGTPPSGMTINTSTGVIQWTPTVAGPFSVTVEASNGVGTPAAQSFTINVVSAVPTISLSPASLSASTAQGSNASSQSFQVRNSGGGTLSYTISDNATWLSCTPTSGTSTGEQDAITVNYATSVLSAGTYTATITITASGATNSPQTIPVSLTVVSSALVWLEAESGILTAPMAMGSDSQASSGSYVWIPQGTGDALNGPSQSVGSVAYTFSVPVAGNYVVWGRLIDNLGNSFYISMDSGAYALWDTAGGSTWGWDLVNNRDVTDPVVYSLGAGQHTLVIKHREDGAKLDRILITNDRAYVPQGQGEVVSSAPLITSTAVTSAVVGQLYTYDVNATGNPAPTYSLVGTPPSGMTINTSTGVIQWTPTVAGPFSVTVEASNGVGTPAAQSFTINVVSAVPTISLSPASLSASTAQGSNASSQSFQVRNSGGGTLSYTISDNATWLSCTPTSGTSTGEQDTITVNYATSVLSAGTYTATITITAPGATNSPQTVPVSLEVVYSAPLITSTPVTSAVVGQLYTYDVNATGVPSPTYSLVGTPPSGMTINTSTGVIQWTPAAAGDYPVTVEASNGAGTPAEQSFTINVVNAVPIISLSPASLSASTVLGTNASSQSFQVSNSGGGTLSYTISDNATWLSCTPTSGTSTGEQNTITVNYATSVLSAGTYTATITIAASGASNTPQTIPVSMTVNAVPSISLSPASLSASTAQGSNASSQSFQVRNSGGGTLSYTISDNATWLSCTPTSGTSTGEQDAITVNYATSVLSAGTYTATITITASGATNSPQTIPVSLTVVSSALVWLEAESGSLTAPMAMGSDSQASSGAYVWIPEGTGNLLNGPSQSVGSVTYTFSVPVAGNYVVWGRLIDNLGNSFYISMDSGAYAIWDTAGGSTWGWDLVNNRDVTDPVVYSLSAGQHTLVIKHREDGAKLDRILITNDRAYVPQGQGEVVSSAPLITSTAVTSAVVGQLYTYDVNATGNPAPTYSLVGTPPSGMTINTSTGVIQWTPTVAGPFSVTVEASNASGVNTQSFTINVVSSVLVWLEAESGILTAPMVMGSDGQASSGAYVWIPEGTGNLLNGPSQSVGSVTYTFSVPVAGNYVVWGRLIDNLGNSFYISMDSGAYAIWDTAGGSTWGWDLVNNRDVTDPVVYSLGAGQHTLVIKHREDGAKLDRILITNDRAYVPQG